MLNLVWSYKTATFSTIFIFGCLQWVVKKTSWFLKLLQYTSFKRMESAIIRLFYKPFFDHLPTIFSWSCHTSSSFGCNGWPQKPLQHVLEFYLNIWFDCVRLYFYILSIFLIENIVWNVGFFWWTPVKFITGTSGR